MPDFRSYCPNLSQVLSDITLSAEESHHLVSVNRARQGDPVVVFDGLGNEWASVISGVGKREVTLEGRQFKKHTLPAHTIALAQAIPKAKGLENIIRKTTELGIQHVFPILSVRTEAKISADKVKSKYDKWKTAAIEGSKQSGNPFLPTIHPAQSLELFLGTQTERFDLRLIASLEKDSQPFHTQIEKAFASQPLSGLFLIGPEGDFSESEYERIKKAGFRAISLGPYVLKCETAATKALSILQYEFTKFE